MTVVVGLDLSLTGTGIARVETDTSIGTDVRTKLLGTKATTDDIAARADRLTGLAHGVIIWCEGADLVCVERPAYSSNTGSATDRSGLFWLVCARIVRGLRIPVVDVVNNHLKMYAVGRGTKVSKDQVLSETVRRYGALVPSLDDNNVADALQLAALGLHHYTGTPLVPLPATHTRALTAVKWPTRQET